MEKATVKLKKMWCFEEYRDVGGIGSQNLFKTKEEALAAAEEEWFHLCESDKSSYIKDPAGVFMVGLVWAEYDEDGEEWMSAGYTDETQGLDGYLEVAKDFLEDK